MFYGYEFPPYVPVAERRRRAQKKIAELKKRGKKVCPVVIEGRVIAGTVWGKAWCDHLEAYSDFESRLPRGRSYARNGSVIDLQLETGKLTAMVSGSEIYDIDIEIGALPRARWSALVKECAGKIDSVVELLTGKLSGGVMEVLCRKGTGLFPSPKEISMSCSCPDGAYLCKHLAAVLYGVGARLDHEPELLFVLRGVDGADLVGAAGKGGMIGKKAKGKHTLEAEGLAGIFGIELDSGPAAKRGRKAKVIPLRPAKRAAVR
ncbi:MAG: SWIM zinc finger family protein [Myxococcaceae bacterium]